MSIHVCIHFILDFNVIRFRFFNYSRSEIDVQDYHVNRSYLEYL